MIMPLFRKILKRQVKDVDSCRECGSYEIPIGGTLCGDCLKEKAKDTE